MLILRVGLKACRLLRIVFLAHTPLGCPTNFERSPFGITVCSGLS